MKHTAQELYKINGAKLYTMDYIITNNIPKATVSRAYSLGTNKDVINIHTANGVIKGYAYGEKTWFDTQEERDEYRAESNKAREEQTKRNKLINAITAKVKDMSEEELVRLLRTL